MARTTRTVFKILAAGFLAFHGGADEAAAERRLPTPGCRCGALAPRAWFPGGGRIPSAVPYGGSPYGIHSGGMPPTGTYRPSPAISSAPPPGTLGWTYRRPTRLVPEEEHPRVGMLEVCIRPAVVARNVKHPNEQIKVSVRGLDEGYVDDDGLWHFKAKELIPGVPHIYDVKFEVIRLDTFVEMRYGRPVELERETKLRTLGYRTVRLIPGRIVELTY